MQRPFIYPYAYNTIILLFTIVTTVVFILLLLLLFCHCWYYKTVATDKLLRASLFSGAAEMTTHMLRFINILWLPLCRINKYGFYFPRRLLRSPILVGHQLPPIRSGSGFCQSTLAKTTRSRARREMACKGRPIPPIPEQLWRYEHRDKPDQSSSKLFRWKSRQAGRAEWPGREDRDGRRRCQPRQGRSAVVAAEMGPAGGGGS
jgi:hypothetical protein